MPCIVVCNSEQMKMPEIDLLARQSHVTVTSCMHVATGAKFIVSRPCPGHALTCLAYALTTSRVNNQDIVC